MARYFPNIAGTNLLNQPTNTTDLLKGGISIVAILGTRLSEVSAQRNSLPALTRFRNK